MTSKSKARKFAAFLLVATVVGALIVSYFGLNDEMVYKNGNISAIVKTKSKICWMDIMKFRIYSDDFKKNIVKEIIIRIEVDGGNVIRCHFNFGENELTEIKKDNFEINLTDEDLSWSGGENSNYVSFCIDIPDDIKKYSGGEIHVVRKTRLRIGAYNQNYRFYVVDCKIDAPEGKNK